MKSKWSSLGLVLVLVIILVLTIGSNQNAAAETVTEVVYGDNYSIGDNGFYQLEDSFSGVITIANSADDVKIIGSSPGTTHLGTNIVIGERTRSLTLTIEDLKIEAPVDVYDSFAGPHGIDFGSAGNYQHKLYIRGENTIVTEARGRAGIHVPDSVELVIGTDSEIDGELTATGGYYGSGIGGGGSDQGSGGTGDNITIIGGAVTATGGYGASGIGGGGTASKPGGSGGNITISGGVVTATGGSRGSGIGGGGSAVASGGTGGIITISNGAAVTATGGLYGSGIGGGGSRDASGGTGGNVSIKGDSTIVNAEGSDGGRDIGSGANNSDGGTLEVLEGAKVTLLGTNKTNAQIRLTLSDFTAEPEGGADTLVPINLSVTVDGIFFAEPQGQISFKANGVEIAGASIVREVGNLHGTAGIDVDDFTGNTYTLTAEYMPGDIDDFYSSDVLEINNYVVSKIDQNSLVINNIPDSITYGDDPFNIEVSGGSVTGGVSFEVTSGDALTVDDSGTVTIEGAGTAEVTVTKAGDEYYNEALTVISITVNKAIPPSVTFPTAGNIIYGQTLGEAVLTGGSGDGSFEWQAPDTISSVENTVYMMIFTPNDTDNYVELEQTVEVTVNLKTLSIKAEDASKVYGDPDPGFTVTYDGFIENEDASHLGGGLVLNREAGDDVGNYST